MLVSLTRTERLMSGEGRPDGQRQFSAMLLKDVDDAAADDGGR
jgi:hypothetical protein